MDDAFDVAIIGAGVVGCATARVLAARGDSVLVLEREAIEGAGTTSRNSGVIHGGLYYPPASRRARTCLRGLELLYDWCAAHDVPHARTGKLVIARSPAEEEALGSLLDNALRSGARQVSLVGAKAVREREPDLPGVTLALLSERTGIVDAHGLTRSLRTDAEARDAVFATRGHVTNIEPDPGGFRLETSRGETRCERLVNTAGLYADEIAAMVGVAGHTIYPCRGDYFRLQTTARYRGLIYPVRPPNYPGLGVHLTLELDGSVRLGPDAEYVEHKDRFEPAEHKHGAFLEATRRLLGPVDPGQLTYDGCGLRPKLRPPHETSERDFVILEQPRGCVHLLGIDSPGLTASMALAEEAAALLV